MAERTQRVVVAAVAVLIASAVLAAGCSSGSGKGLGSPGGSTLGSSTERPALDPTTKLCSLLDGAAPVTVGGTRPQMATFLAAPFTATDLHGHFDVIVYLKPKQADKLDAVADLVRQQPGMREVSELDQRAAYEEFRRIARGTRYAGALEESDVPPSVRASSASDADVEQMSTRLRADSRVSGVRVQTGARWATEFDGESALASEIATIGKLARVAHLAEAQELAEAWADMFRLPNDFVDPESAKAKAQQQASVALFPRYRFDHLDNVAQQFLAATKTACS